MGDEVWVHSALRGGAVDASGVALDTLDGPSGMWAGRRAHRQTTPCTRVGARRSVNPWDPWTPPLRPVPP